MDSDTMKKRLRYQGGQYANGQVARGGGQREPHMLEQAADYMERLEDMLLLRLQRAWVFPAGQAQVC